MKTFYFTKHTFFLALLCALLSVNINANTIGSGNTYVPDDNFEQALIDMGLDSGPLDDLVITANISSLTSLNLSNKGIQDMTGIEDFISLKKLDCNNNNLRSLHVEKLTQLNHLSFSNNNISTIDVRNLTQLKYLSFSKNNIYSLDVSNLTQLESLIAYKNSISRLDISNNTALKRLNIWENNLTSLNLSNNTLLNTLYCSNNRLKELDVNNNTALKILSVWDNNLTTLNVSNNPLLKDLECSNNRLEELDVRSNTALQLLSVWDNNLTRLDVRNNPLLKNLQCSRNKLTSLDLSNNPSLQEINVSDNSLTTLNIKNGTLADQYYVRFISTDNPDLTCISVDDVPWSEANLTRIDAHTGFNLNCNAIKIYAKKQGASNAPRIHVWPNETNPVNWPNNLPFMAPSTGGYFVFEVSAEQTEVNTLFIFDGVQTEDLNNITQDTWFTISSNGNITRTTTEPTPIKIYAKKDGVSYAPRIHVWPHETNTANWPNNLPFMTASTDGYFVYEITGGQAQVSTLFIFEGIKTPDLNNIREDTWFTVASNGKITRTTTPPSSSISKHSSSLVADQKFANSIRGLIIAPSPASNYIQVKHPHSESEVGTITVNNLKGQRVIFKSFHSKLELEELIDVSGLEQGIYVLSVQLEANQETTKFSIVR